MCKLSRIEQETIINFNVAEADAIVFTRDKSVMKRLDALVNEFPDIFKCIETTDIDKTYSMPKQRVKFRRPRRISAKQREAARETTQERGCSL